MPQQILLSLMCVGPARYLGPIKAVQGPEIEAKSLPSMDSIEIKFNPAGIGHAHAHTRIHTRIYTHIHTCGTKEIGIRGHHVGMVTPLVDDFLWITCLPGQPGVQNHMMEGHMILTGVQSHDLVLDYFQNSIFSLYLLWNENDLCQTITTRHVRVPCWYNEPVLIPAYTGTQPRKMTRFTTVKPL